MTRESHHAKVPDPDLRFPVLGSSASQNQMPSQFPRAKKNRHPFLVGWLYRGTNKGTIGCNWGNCTAPLLVAWSSKVRTPQVTLSVPPLPGLELRFLA